MKILLPPKNSRDFTSNSPGGEPHQVAEKHLVNGWSAHVSSRHPALGVVRLDYEYPPAPGDSDHPGRCGLRDFRRPRWYKDLGPQTTKLRSVGANNSNVTMVRSIAFSWCVHNSNVTMVYGTYNKLVFMG